MTLSSQNMLAIVMQLNSMKDRIKSDSFTFITLARGPTRICPAHLTLHAHTHTDWESLLKELGLEKNFKEWVGH